MKLTYTPPLRDQRDKVPRSTRVILLVFAGLVLLITAFGLGYTLGLSQATKPNLPSMSEVVTTPQLEISNAEPVATEQLQQMIDQRQTGFVLICRPTCSYCQKFVPLLNETLASYPDTKIYYYDIDAARRADAAAYERMLDHLSVQGTPTLLYMQNGAELARLRETTKRPAIEQFLLQYRDR
jgi:predicted bacteriocin transport accessory protein